MITRLLHPAKPNHGQALPAAGLFSSSCKTGVGMTSLLSACRFEFINRCTLQQKRTQKSKRRYSRPVTQFQLAMIFERSARSGVADWGSSGAYCNTMRLPTKKPEYNTATQKSSYCWATWASGAPAYQLMNWAGSGKRPHTPVKS
jgi:hypothetical protein